VERRKKIALVVLVLGVGVGVALQFRKADSDHSPADDPKSPIRSDEVVASPPWQSSDTVKPEAAPAADNSASADDGSIAAHSAPSHQIDPVSTVPRPNLSSLLEVNRAATMVDLRAPEQTHTLVDGDTLSKLATRYLGSAEHSQALFDHNRDVLRNPDELPIGAVLRIPSPVTLPPAADQVAPSSSPIDPPPVPATPSAPVKLNRLINADATKAAPQRRTYTVQPGDSLVDIARKLYGDGRRYETLFEANRQVLTTPTQLKPGTVLVVP